jgi:ketosteroid isomerase-like protein
VLVEVDRAFSEATASKGIEGFAPFIAEDMTSIVPDQPIAQGKETFVERYKTFLSTPGFAFRWTPDLGRISEDGTLGFTVGHYRATKTENGSAQTVGSGKYVTIWAKQADGSWKVVFDSGVRDTKPPAS